MYRFDGAHSMVAGGFQELVRKMSHGTFVRSLITVYMVLYGKSTVEYCIDNEVCIVNYSEGMEVGYTEAMSTEAYRVQCIVE